MSVNIYQDGKLKNIAGTHADSALDATSTNAIQNKVVTQEFSRLNQNLVANIYVGDDGKLHKVQGGADTVLPFSSGAKATASLSVAYSRTNDGDLYQGFALTSNSEIFRCPSHSSSTITIMKKGSVSWQGYAGYYGNGSACTLYKNGSVIATWEANVSGYKNGNIDVSPGDIITLSASKDGRMQRHAQVHLIFN